jgi:hypothetical protein
MPETERGVYGQTESPDRIAEIALLSVLTVSREHSGLGDINTLRMKGARQSEKPLGGVIARHAGKLTARRSSFIVRKNRTSMINDCQLERSGIVHASASSQQPTLSVDSGRAVATDLHLRLSQTTSNKRKAASDHTVSTVDNKRGN